MEVKFGIGLDDLIFGMSQDNVKSILGEPNKVTYEELDFAIIYYYNKKMIKTKFDRDENLRLYSIEVFNLEVIMFNQNAIKQSKGEILTLLANQGYDDLVYEDYDTFETVFCEKIWTTFSFEFNNLISFEFSPLFRGDGETIIWPKRRLQLVKV